MTDHKNNEYLIEANKLNGWTKYACMSFGVIVVMGNLIFMLLGK